MSKTNELTETAQILANIRQTLNNITIDNEVEANIFGLLVDEMLSRYVKEEDDEATNISFIERELRARLVKRLSGEVGNYVIGFMPASSSLQVVEGENGCIIHNVFETSREIHPIGKTTKDDAETLANKFLEKHLDEITSDVNRIGTFVAANHSTLRAFGGEKAFDEISKWADEIEEEKLMSLLVLLEKKVYGDDTVSKTKKTQLTDKQLQDLKAKGETKLPKDMRK